MELILPPFETVCDFHLPLTEAPSKQEQLPVFAVVEVVCQMGP